jgi:EmrB/QacA subfamily drug resistance transporter
VDDTSAVSSDPGAASGDPGAASGDPGAASGDPGAVSGDPGRASGDPGRASGDPGRASGDSAPTATAKRLLPWLVAVGFFMESLDTTILNTAVPAIAHALEVPPLDMKAVLASYTLSLAVFIPISGWTANRFGTRRVFASAIGIFTLGSFLCGLSTNIHVLVACRILQGCGGAMMLPVGRLTMVRTFAKSELIRAMSFVAMPGLIGPMLGPLIGGLIIAYFHWSVIFFVNIPIGLAGLVLVRKHLPNYRAAKNYPVDFVGLALFGAGVSLLSYVLEVFGDHALSGREIAGLLTLSAALLAAYGMHSVRALHPLLRLGLLRIRSFRVAVSGNLLTRLGIGGLPFLLPLLYQIGLGYTPIQSGLMIMPQALAAISFKFTLPVILKRFGYRQVLIANTVMLGVMLMLFSLIDSGTPGWLVAFLAFVYGFFTSTQYTSMNTLAYADVNNEQASAASTIASTVQQMAVSFGVAAASLTAALFIPDHTRASAPQMIHGIHLALRSLGAWTILSTVVFGELRSNDGEAVSSHKAGINAA